jgi:hypothetical protein
MAKPCLVPKAGTFLLPQAVVQIAKISGDDESGLVQCSHELSLWYFKQLENTPNKNIIKKIRGKSYYTFYTLG